MAGNALAFTIALVDRMSAPAKVMTASLGALETQLKSVLDLAKQLSELGIKAPKIPPLPSSGANERAQKMHGPSRKDFDAQQRMLASAPWKGPEQILKPVQLANGELELLKQQLRDDKLAVTNLSASLRQLKSATVPNVAAIQSAEKELQRYKNSLGETQSKLVASGNAFRFGSEGTNRLTTTLRELAEAAGAGGAVGRLTELRARVAGVASPLEELTGLGPRAAIGIAAITVAAVAAAAAAWKLGSAIVGLVKGGAMMAINASEARGDTVDMLEAFLGARDVAEQTFDKLSAIGDISAASQKSIQAAAQALSAAGVTASDRLTASVRSIAQVESVMEGGGSRIQSIIERATQSDAFTLDARRLKGTGIQLTAFYEAMAKRTGQGVKQVEAQLKAGKIKANDGIDALNDVIETKFGKLALGQAGDYAVQIQRLHDKFKKLFEKVDTGPFGAALARIVALLDKASPSGKALADVFEATFGGLFKLIDQLSPYLEIAFLGLELMALKVLNAFKPVAKQLGITFGGDQVSKQEAFAKSTLLVADGIGKVAGWLGQIMAKKPAIDGLIQGFSLLLAPVIWVGKMLASVTAALFLLGVAVTAAGAWLLGLGQMAVQAGTNFVTGLIRGITGGAGQLVDSVRAMGQGALDAFQGFFKMHSPSRLMMKQGEFISLGVAAGIDQGAPVANDNMRDMLAVPPPRVNESRARGASSERPVVHIDQITISGVQNAEDIRREMPEVMADVMEQAALMVGTR
jgi:hypothetical protein